ncbi:MAG: sulfite exporter TauE/SafE family protein [Bacteroidia bacterium]
MLYLSAFLTGLFSSLHCVGMCGPIAFALPKKPHSINKIITGRLIYNFGRIITYSLLGLVFGLFGLGLKLAGFQQSVSIIAGVIIFISAITSIVTKKVIGSTSIFSFFNSTFIKKLFGNASHQSMLAVGIINGFLPCGFVYIALIGSSVTQHAVSGMLFMMLFGLGTLPLMFGVSMFGQFVSQKIRNYFSKATPYLAILIALLFVLRGLNLGIPYVSPKINTVTQQTEICH